MRTGPHYLLRVVLLCGAALPLSAQYHGGDGDGHYMADIAFTLAAYDPGTLYSGGSGDGHAMLDLAFTLSAYAPTALFRGGAGDGHDMLVAAFTLAAYDPIALFSGGAGDGHDMALFGPGSPFPLTLLTFEAVAGADYVLLKWVTADEVDTDYFSVEKSRDGIHYNSIGRTPAAGNTSRGVETHYTFEDGSPWEGLTYYRLRSTDLNGTFLLSNIRTVDFRRAAGWDFTVFPNPNDGSRLAIQLTGGEHQGPIHTDLYSGSGQRILNHTFPAEVTGRYTLPVVDLGLTSGSYFIRVTAGEEQISKLLVVRKR